MDILISGSICYDRIMNFPGKFSDHIMPDKMHILSAAFMLDKVTESFGGTAMNIAYNLSLLGERPKVFGVVGADFEKYEKWLKKKNIDFSNVKKIKGALTACAYMMVDKEDNQLSAFYPGPAGSLHRAESEESGENGKIFFSKQRCLYDKGIPRLRPSAELCRGTSLGMTHGGKSVNEEGELAIVAAEYPKRMMEFVKMYKEKKIPYVFDPGQQIPELKAEELYEGISGAEVFIGNDYEAQMAGDRMCSLEKSEKFLKPVKGKKIGKNVEEEIGNWKLEIERIDGRGAIHLVSGVNGIAHNEGSGSKERITMLKDMVEILVITKGAKGSEIYHQGKKIVVPAVKAKNAVDPTGAGDAYRAGFIKGLAEGWSLEKAGKFASLIAAYAVEKYGTQSHEFTWGELEERYFFNYKERI